MNWYKESQAMFETLGLEDKLFQSFRRHHKYVLDKYKNSRGFMRGRFNKDQSFDLGSARIGNELSSIFERHGEPKFDYPKAIRFVAYHPNHPDVGDDWSATFEHNDGEYVMGIVMPSFTDYKFDAKSLKSIKHELQHFIKSIYEGEEATDKSIEESSQEEGDMEGHYSDPWEIQSYSQYIADKGFDNFMNFIGPELDVYILSGEYDRANQLLDKMASPDKSSSFFDMFLKEPIRISKDKMESASGEKMPSKVLRQYYQSSLRNFNMMITKFFNDKRSEIEDRMDDIDDIDGMGAIDEVGYEDMVEAEGCTSPQQVYSDPAAVQKIEGLVPTRRKKKKRKKCDKGKCTLPLKS